MLNGPDQDVGQSPEALGEQSQGDALAGARVAREHGEAAVGDPDLDASGEAVDGGGGEEGIDGDIGPERVELQAVEGEQFGHESSGGMSSVLRWGK
jgi:hypothetical protein